LLPPLESFEDSGRGVVEKNRRFDKEKKGIQGEGRVAGVTKGKRGGQIRHPDRPAGGGGLNGRKRS